MDVKDLLPAADIGLSNAHLPVKTAGTQDRRIQDIDPVGGRHDDDPLVDTEAVHFHQKLV